MMRLDFIEICLGIISQLWKSTFKKFAPVVVQILDYHATYLEDSQLAQDPSDAAEKQVIIIEGYMHMFIYPWKTHTTSIEITFNNNYFFTFLITQAFGCTFCSHITWTNSSGGQESPY